MHAATPSRTALSVAIRRACHQAFDPPPRVLLDPIAVPILGHTYRAALERSRETLNEPFPRGMRAFLLARSRYAEETLARAVGAGCRQYCLLGAGLDTFAHRNPYADVSVFEVDHPATQQWKRELLAESELPTPRNLHYAPVDFERQSLAAQLAEAGLDAAAPTVFAWLGVVPYLSPEAFRGTVEYLSGFPAGSALIFDYGVPSEMLPSDERAGRELLMARVAAIGEPFRMFLSPAQAAAELAAFQAIEDLGSAELNARYFSGRTDTLRLSGSSGRVLSAWRGVTPRP
jgi:methyltransferase (TIGR00027 family)